MPRQPVLLAAVSVLALCATACAETGTPSVSPQAAASKNVPAPQSTAQKLAALPGANLESELRQAQTLRAQGHAAEAIRALAQLVLVAPDDPRVIGEYGKALVQLGGRSEDAVAFLKRGVQLKAGDSTFYSALGVAYDQMDDSKNAAAAYERALALYPGDPVVLNNYAVSRMLAGDFNRAEKLLRQAQMAGGYNPKLASNLALLAQMKTARGSFVAVNAATRPPQTLAGTPANFKPGDVTKPAPAVASAAANTKPAASPPSRTTMAMQPAPKQTSVAPVKIANAPAQMTATASPNAKPAVPPPQTRSAVLMQPAPKEASTIQAKIADTPAQTTVTASGNTKPLAQPPARSTVVMQPVPKDTAAATRLANRPPQAVASAPLNIRPAAPPPLPSTVVMQPVPKDAEAGPVKVAARPARQPAAHSPAAANTKLAKNVPAKPAPAKSSVPALRTADQGE